MQSKIIAELNPSQSEAVLHPSGPVLVLAGAGSGKTRIITRRIAHLICERGEKPFNILAVTFTNKAANEMKERIHSLVGDSARNLWIGTFHSISLRILKREIDKLEGFRSDFVIYDEGDQLKLIRECMGRLGFGDQLFDPRSARSQIDSAKSRGLAPGDAADDLSLDEKISKIYYLYEQELRRSNALDFADLLRFTALILEKLPDVLEKYREQFRHILVDEYQDTNSLQYKIVKLLSQKHRNILVVGDDNQSIYGWRGADISNILGFERDFPDAAIIKLEQNYRSTGNILKAAGALILRNRLRRDKTLWTDNPEGDLISYYEAYDERDEARYVAGQIQSDRAASGRAYRDFAVFYRTNNQSRLIEEQLLRSQIPYALVGGVGFYDRAEIRDIMAYLRFITNQLDDISLKRIINTPPRGIGRATVDALDSIARARGTSLFDAIGFAVENAVFPKKTLGGIAKFHVLLSGLIDLSKRVSIAELLGEALRMTGYLTMLEGEPERLDNLGEILNLTAEFEKDNSEQRRSLHDFLDSVTLASDVDGFNDRADQVTLMTVHSSKGLEFPVVFIIGVEEKLFPHERSLQSGKLIEEERRLCYVGITRAKEKLHLISASKRRFFGIEKTPVPSRFISEIPRNLLRWTSFQAATSAQRPYSLRDSSARASSRVENFSDDGFSAGERVSHPSFGQGVVKRIEGAGGDAKLVIAFPNYGEKKIVATFLGLKRL
ncbi:MAG: ATP-dependent helicase [Deltaproteobacteria bacterium]